MDKLEAAREDLAARRLINRDTDTPVGQVTFSAGVADAMAYAAPHDALSAADGALLRAKDQEPCRRRRRFIEAGERRMRVN